MPSAIKVENLSKIYRLGEIGTGTLSKDIHRWFTTKVRGKEDPFLKIGQTNDRTVKADSALVYSLKNIDFDINQGEAVGIIGRNGAGKSTLLKILSRVTAPTTGKINIKGRVASLLEVGTGFHPELTGRENIYLNGAILGMRKKEITRKLDEIIDFSGVERYIDTPVKRYSSGMYVRLAFAVAAHLESEILIVDEVLAVGDAEFQKKCLGKMSDVSKGDGRTVLFVSHNMGAINQLCSSAVLLANGSIAFEGTAKKATDYYLNATSSDEINSVTIPKGKSSINSGEGYITKVSLNNTKGVQTYEFNSGDPIVLNLELEMKTQVKSAMIDFKIISNDGVVIAHIMNRYDHQSFDLESGTSTLTAQFTNTLQPGVYKLTVGIHNNYGLTIDYLESIVQFTIHNQHAMSENLLHGHMYYPARWEIHNL
jgi:lipopolysaccharide transport system ATP-binding protein